MPVTDVLKRLHRYQNSNFILIIFFVLTCANVDAQKVPINTDITKQSFIYAIKDSLALGIDIYTKKEFDTAGKRPCVLFLFGGAFIGGRRDDSVYFKYFNFLVEHNYIVASISYRLGLRGVKKVSAFNTAPLKNAVDMAAEDVYDATNWLITKADSVNIDTSKIILSGSSAGAITVLQTEFLKENNKPVAKKLPPNFQYAGIISFAGAILSYDGRLKYRHKPAPMLLFHGTEDKIVPYKKIRLFKKGFYGSSHIAKIAHKKGYYYYIVREAGSGHEVAILPMYQQLPVILYFLNTYIMAKKPYQADMYFKNFDQRPAFTLSAKELIKKLQAR